MNQYTTIVNPKGVEVEVNTIDVPKLLKKGFKTLDVFNREQMKLETISDQKYVYVRNKHGMVNEVESSQLERLLANGFELANESEYHQVTKINAIKVDWSMPTTPSYGFDGYGRLVTFIASRFIPNQTSKVHLVFGQPQGIPTEKGDKLVLLTMFEADHIPQEWVDNANKYYDHIIVPAQFSVDVFKSCGVTTPITKIPLFATEFEIYEPESDPFVFSMQNAMVDGAQKGWDLVIRAFLTLFKDDPSAKLILKARKQDWAHVRWYEQFFDKEDNIELIKEDWQYEELHSKLYAQTNCFVFPSRGEGWGLPPLEAMAHGIPTILTKAHSHTEFSRYGIEIGYTGDSFSYYLNRVREAGIGRWVEPNFDELVEAMKHVYEHYKKEKKRAIKYAPKIEKHFNGDLFIKRLKDFMDSLCEK